MSRGLPRSPARVIYGAQELARKSWVSLARTATSCLLGKIQIDYSLLSLSSAMIPDYDDGGMLSLRAGLVVTKPLVFEQGSDKASTGLPMHSSTRAQLESWR